MGEEVKGQLRKKPIWLNRTRYGERPYVGSYRMDGIWRVFVLESTMEDGQPHSMEYCSHFQAMRNGWEKQR